MKNYLTYEVHSIRLITDKGEVWRLYTLPILDLKLIFMTIKIPQIDDFGDRKLNALATKYRNALQDTRPSLANLYLLELVNPLDRELVKKLTTYFNQSIEQNTKVDTDVMNEILESNFPADAIY